MRGKGDSSAGSIDERNQSGAQPYPAESSYADVGITALGVVE
jgi:hypothetical protein